MQNQESTPMSPDPFLACMVGSENETTYLRTMDRTRDPKGQVAVHSNLHERTKIEVPGEKYEISIKLSIFIYSIKPWKYTRCFILWIFIRLECLHMLHEIADSASWDHTPLQPHNWGVWLAIATSEIETMSLQRTRVLPPMCPIIQRFQCISRAKGGSRIFRIGARWGCNTRHAKILGHNHFVECCILKVWVYQGSAQFVEGNV